jgi:hypothetical protein
MVFSKTNSKKKYHKKALGFIELAISILIIAVLIAAVFYGRNLVKKSYILSAQSLTKASAVNSIKDLSLWLETSLENSFDNNEIDDGSNINYWKTIQHGYKITVTAPNVSNQPIYSNTINNIPAVAFDGVNSYLEFDGSFLNRTNYTIFILEKRQSDKNNNYFFGDSSITTSNQNIILGYESDGKVMHSQGGSNKYNSSVSTYSDSADSPRIFSFVFDSLVGKRTYINGYLAGQDSNTSYLSNISTLKIGKGYEGEIGEIVIFSRALKASEREDVENYLGRKWSIKVSTGTCEGTVTLNGCNEGKCSGAIPGVTDIIEAADGKTGTTTCNDTGYTGTVGYSCSNKVLSVTSACNCGSGYSISGGSCVQNCSVSKAGVSETEVAVGSGSLACNVNGYNGSVNYSCTSGAATITGSCGLDPCTGGNITTVGSAKVHRFTSSGTLSCTIGRTAKVLVVAGGGGGGGVGWGNSSGGGGGGGVIYNDSYSIPNGGGSVTVGGGGAAGNSASKGQNSTFGSLTAIGGGYSNVFQNTAAFAGGSGGGGVSTSGGTTGGSGTSGQGNKGGNFNTFSCDGVGGNRTSGGGGGAGQPGQDGQNGFGGKGGDGLSFDITGTPTYYAGGGGGVNRICGPAPRIGNGALGGLGGGGTGNTSAGSPNTGGGGGFNKAGGSGVVIISY